MDRASQDFIDLCHAWGTLTPGQRNQICIIAWIARNRAVLMAGAVFASLLVLRLMY